MSAGSPAGPPSRQVWRWIGAGATAVAIVAAGWLLYPTLAGLFRNQEALRRFIDAQGTWGPVVFMALQAAQVLIAPIPGHVLAFASGFLFGPWLGTVYTAAGVAVGSAAALTLARLFGRPLVVHFVPQTALARLDYWAARRGPLFFFVLFMLPFMPDDLACFAVGLSPLPLLPMLGIIILARLPGHFASAWLGATAQWLSPAGWMILFAGGLILFGLYWRHRVAVERWILARLPQGQEWRK